MITPKSPKNVGELVTDAVKRALRRTEEDDEGGIIGDRIVEEVFEVVSVALAEKDTDIDQEIERCFNARERAEAKLAETTKYAVKLHMLVSDVQAVNLQLVGALEDMKGVFKWPETVEQLAAVAKADVALSGDGVAPYQELWKVLPAILQKLRVVAANYSGDKETRDVLIPAMSAALQSAKRGGAMSYEPITYCAVCNEPFDVYRAPEDRRCEGCIDVLIAEYGRAELGVDGNAGFALIGPDLQEGEAEFVTVENTDKGRAEAERWAATAAYRKLQKRLRRNFSYYIGTSHPDHV